MSCKTIKNKLALSSRELKQEQKGGPYRKAALKVKVSRGQTAGNSSWPTEPLKATVAAKPIKKDPEIKARKIFKKSSDYPSADEVIHRARVEKEKRIAMWSGVSFLMLLVVFFWFINTKNMILQNRSQGSQSGLAEIWQDSGRDFEESLAEIGQEWEQVKAGLEKVAASNTPATVANSSSTPGLPDNADNPDNPDTPGQELTDL